jgi:glycosyltransferase involved in cell wall biosynthesis
MDICFIAGTLGRGGAEKQLVYMLRALVQGGEDVRLLCLTKGEAYEEEIRALGIEVEFVGASSNRISRLIAITRNLRKRRPDIIQSSHFYTNIYASVAGMILRIPSVGAVRSNLRSELKINGSLGKAQLGLPDLIIANSEAAREYAVSRGSNPERIMVVQNVIEPRETDRPSPPAGKLVTFLFAGRLGQEKRPDRFIQMAADLIEQNPTDPLRFLMAGDGVLRPTLEETVRKVPSLSEKFEFLGEVSNMDQVFQDADVLVLTSDYEGTPNVILEAMAAGLPVIANNVGGVEALIGRDRGVLVDPTDDNALTAAAANFLRDPEMNRKLAQNAIAKVRRDHSPDQLYGQLTRIYAKILRAGNAEDPASVTI